MYQFPDFYLQGDPLGAPQTLKLIILYILITLNQKTDLDLDESLVRAHQDLVSEVNLLGVTPRTLEPVFFLFTSNFMIF